MMASIQYGEEQALIIEVESAVSKLGITVAYDAISSLVTFAIMMHKWNKTYNLTAIKTVKAILTQHILDSLSIIASLDKYFANRRVEQPIIVDVGSGGGLPGVVLAIVRPNYKVICVDAVEKKISFIRASASQLKIKNLIAVHARIETLDAMQADVVISRAFASLSNFFEMTKHHIRTRGALIAMKSKRVNEELSEMKPSSLGRFKSKIETLTVFGLDVSRCLVWLEEE